MKHHLFLSVFCALLLCGCRSYSEKEGTLVCGIPVKGSPWQFAAALADDSKHAFTPESVTVFEKKAYIRGYVNTNLSEHPHREPPYENGFVPAEIWCELENGKAVKARLYQSVFD